MPIIGAVPWELIDKTPTFTWVLPQDPGVGTIGCHLEIWYNGALLIGPITIEQTGSNFSWTVPEENKLTGNGQFELRVWSYDKVGKESAPAVCRFALDVTPPTVTIVNPVDGATLSTNESSTIIAWISDFTRVEMKLDENGWEDVTAKIHPGGLLFYFLNVPLAPGQHTITLKPGTKPATRTLRPSPLL